MNTILLQSTCLIFAAMFCIRATHIHDRYAHHGIAYFIDCLLWLVNYPIEAIRTFDNHLKSKIADKVFNDYIKDGAELRGICWAKLKEVGIKPRIDTHPANLLMQYIDGLTIHAIYLENTITLSEIMMHDDDFTTLEETGLNKEQKAALNRLKIARKRLHDASRTNQLVDYLQSQCLKAQTTFINNSGRSNHLLKSKESAQ